MHGVIVSKYIVAHFHPSLQIKADRELHLFHGFN